MSLTGDEANELAPPASWGDHSSLPVANSSGCVQGLDVSKRATDNVQLSEDKGVQKGSQLGHFTIPLSGMVDLTTEFVEKTHSLGANILNELNKLKELTAPRKAYIGKSLTRLENFIVRQHAWLVLLDGNASPMESLKTGNRPGLKS